MHNWSVDIKEFKKEARKFSIWRLEQMINFGADGERIPEKELRQYWSELTLDEAKRRFLGFLLWGENYLTQDK